MSVLEAKRAGARAAQLDIGLARNPYFPGTTKYLWWKEGYLQQELSQQELRSTNGKMQARLNTQSRILAKLSSRGVEQ